MKFIVFILLFIIVPIYGDIIPLPEDSLTLYEENGISYVLLNGSAKIIDCDDALTGNIIIPKYVNGYEVNCILSEAFKDCVLIESIFLPDNNLFIEDLAFENCAALNYLYFLGDLPSEYINNEFLDNLYIENYADLILSNIEQKGTEQIRSELQAAFSSWTGNLSNLAPHNDENGNPVFTDNEGNGLEDDMIDYFVDEFLDLSLTNTYSEKLYELAKFGGRVRNFLNRSHPTYGRDYGYVWHLTPSSGGRSLGDILYDTLANSSYVIGAPSITVSKQAFNLDRYINISTYRSELQDYSYADKNLLDSNYLEIDDGYAITNPWLGILTDPNAAMNPNLQPYLINPDEFSLTTDGERLIYDSIADWLIKGINGVDREMLALESVEIWDPSYVLDGFINVNDPDEVELQKRAIAKRIYDILIEEVNDPNSNNEFWDATFKVSDFFKNQLHPTYNYSWMWNNYIQPKLLLILNAVVEDSSYLDADSNFLDFNGDGIRDLGYAKYPSDETYKNVSSLYKEISDIVKESYPPRNNDGYSIRTEAYENGYFPYEIYDFFPYVDRTGTPIRDSETGAQIVREEVVLNQFFTNELKDLPKIDSYQMINPFLFINDKFEIRVNTDHYNISRYKGISVSSFDASDNDTDGVINILDAFPDNPNEHKDSDHDGFGDNEDKHPGFNDVDLENYLNLNQYLRSFDIQDLRPGSTIIEVSGNQATVQLQMQESSDLQTWTDTGTPATMTIPADTDTKFFRFKMTE